MTWATDMWAAAIRASEALHKRAQEVARIRHEHRKERRREAYALRKRLGLPTRKPKPEPVPEVAPEPATDCYCAHTPRPPCGWCESGGGA